MILFHVAPHLYCRFCICFILVVYMGIFFLVKPVSVLRKYVDLQELYKNRVRLK